MGRPVLFRLSQEVFLVIAGNIAKVRARIEAAKERSGRKDDVLLVAVTKNHGADAMREAIAAGARAVGESRIQEAKGKFDLFHDAPVGWHLIGRLQTNKAKQAVQMFDIIESVDTLHLAQAVNKEAGKIGKVQDVLAQVNLAREPQKGGVPLEALPALLRTCDRLPYVRVRGLMFVAPDYEDREKCRPLFRKMREIFDEARASAWETSRFDFLSMGMTHDFEIAVEEGANIVRVGTSIFGPRQY